MDLGAFPLALFWGCSQRPQDGIGEDPSGVTWGYASGKVGWEKLGGGLQSNGSTNPKGKDFS